MGKSFLVIACATFFGFSQLIVPNSVHAAKIVNDVGDPIELTLNTGKLIKLEKGASSVFVGNPELADVQVQSPTIIYVFAKKAGTTNLFALDGKGNVLLNSPVSIEYDVSGLQKTLREVAESDKINVISVVEGLLLTGRVKSAAVAEDIRRVANLYAPGEKVINRLSVQGAQQVNLRVQVAEVSRSVTKQLGVNWENLSAFGNFGFGFARGPDIVNATGNILTSTATNNIYAGFNDGQTAINALIDALEEDGLITVLAEPNLTALSGETASFLAGGEFPIPVPQEGGTISIDYKEFGVSLDFTPTLVNDNRINLKVRPEVSQLSSASAINVGGIFVQSLLTRRADTTVELASGQSFVLGGLLNSDSDNSISKTPLLGELPIIGALFRSTSFQRNETELVIIVTPYLVKPTNSRIALPTDGYVPPNDTDFYKDGKQFKPTIGEEDTRDPGKPTTAQEDVKLIGPAGFITE
jgi:pilus assembly protein CpaC